MDGKCNKRVKYNKILILNIMGILLLKMQNEVLGQKIIIKQCSILIISLINKESKLSIWRYSLINKIVLSGYNFHSYGENNETFPHLLNRDSDMVKCNPIYESFRNVSFLNFYWNNPNKTIKILTDARDLELYIGKLYFRAQSYEEIMKITNPEIFPK